MLRLLHRGGWDGDQRNVVAAIRSDDDVKAHGHRYRTPIEMWISDDGMRSWGRK